jgi:hypothetical protein
VQKLALNMLNRAHLHTGDTELADDFGRQADAIPDAPTRPRGALGDALLYEQAASRSIRHLDLGQWEDDDPAHAAVTTLIGHLAPPHWPTDSERFNLFMLLQTAARRHMYLGRLHGDLDRLKVAWHTATTMPAPAVREIVAYATDQRLRRDTTMVRYRNLLIDIAWSAAWLGGPPPAWMDVIANLLPEPIDDCLATPNGEPFNVLAALRWRETTGDPIDERAMLAAWAPIAPQGPIAYPTTCIAEHLIWAAPEAGRDIANRLATSYRECTPGILEVLRLRSHQAVLASASQTPMANPPPMPSPPTSAALQPLFQNLASSADTIRHRCPY